MRMFDVYYSGVISIEAESKEEARNEFYHRYWDYGDIDDINSIEDEEEMEEDD